MNVQITKHIRVKTSRYLRLRPKNLLMSAVSPPYSDGPLRLPYQRPAPSCRTFKSESVETVISDFKTRIKDPDLARLFENAFPNTLDTTVRWHVDGTAPKRQQRSPAHSDTWYAEEEGKWEGTQSFIVTGDITAEWLRDSTNQLAQYQVLAKKDEKIRNLILGAINTQAEYVIESPFCNAFQPPPPSGLDAASNGQMDATNPPYEPSKVFECKYELDSLAAFLSLGNQFYAHTGNTSFLTSRWKRALTSLLDTLGTQSIPTFDSSGRYVRNYYTFQRQTNTGTETLNLQGVGNPLANGTGLIRSAFRPSDDATILGFLVPANAMMAVELQRTSEILKKVGGTGSELADELSERASIIREGIMKHAVFTHPLFGKVFAYEVDGYGGRIFMDDANLPSLLSLPLLGFIPSTDSTLREIYSNTRKMILSPQGNPYYLSGSFFSGIGGPHIGLTHAWPMSQLVRAMTSDNDTEILESLDLVKRASKLGLINESVNVNYDSDPTRKFLGQ
jgi:uncharacterized protein